jgi:hypothetical protein
VLGVDPGSQSGWARFLGAGHTPGRLDHCGVISSSKVCAIARTVHPGLPPEAPLGLYLAIEEQWIPRPGRNPSAAAGAKSHAQATAALGVAEVRGVWRGLAIAAGYSVHVIHPSTWRSAVLGPHYASAPRAQVKALALEVVAARFGLKLLKKHDHAAEAILLAEYLDTMIRTQTPTKG